jgi:hypothetical protein
MYLMDEIAATAFRVTPDDWAEPILRIFPELVERMRATPRFLLDEHVIRAAIELSLGRPTVFREAMRHLRVPHKRLWVEWQETSRDTLRRRLQEDKRPPDPLKPIPERLGFLVEAEPGGRRGVVTWAWRECGRTTRSKPKPFVMSGGRRNTALRPGADTC